MSRWEQQLEQTWDVVQEDEHGALVVLESADELLRRRRRRDVQSNVRRGMDRHVFLVLDNSAAMEVVDMKPWDRRTATLQLAEKFVRDFFDQNPISHLGIVVTANGVAVKVTDLSGSPDRHIARLRQLSEQGGEPSLQNALQVALASLAFVPKYGSREIVCIMASLTTCDPSNVHDTIAELRNERVRCSVVCLSAEVGIYKSLAVRTRGTFVVPLHIEGFRDALLDHTSPPPTTDRVKASLIQMGFPRAHQSEHPLLCVCHRELRHGAFQCPRCHARCCELPTTCLVCGLALLSSPHLARSYHHLYPILPFEVHAVAAGAAIECVGCLQPCTAQAFQCTECTGMFCNDCDAFVHDLLHNCPSCEAAPARKT
jgi:transcription initiation factor TFIIH subunit 2